MFLQIKRFFGLTWDVGVEVELFVGEFRLDAVGHRQHSCLVQVQAEAGKLEFLLKKSYIFLFTNI